MYSRNVGFHHGQLPLWASDPAWPGSMVEETVNVIIPVVCLQNMG